MRRQASLPGYLTVYLSLSLGIILSLFMTLIMGARRNANRMQLECVTDISVNAALAEFHRELFRQYDLLMVDCSYGGSQPSDQLLQNHVQGYFDKNLETSVWLPFQDVKTVTGLQPGDVALTGTRYASDLDGQAVREQIYAYMAADPVGGVVANFLAQVDQFKGLELGSGEWQRKREENTKALAEAPRPTVEDEEGNEVEVELENPADAVDAYRSTPVLSQLFTGEGSVSEASCATGTLLSGRSLHTGTGLEVENSHHYPEADAILMDEYLLEKCGCYTDPLSKGVLTYQVEYILAGEGTDRGNLEKMCERLLLIRGAANCIAIFGDEARKMEAETAATVLTAVILLPELADLVTTAILFAWAYVESLQDVATLLKGGKVPLLKSSAEWGTPMAYILSPSLATQGRVGGTGIGYQDYLRIFLYLENQSVKTERLMDVMEMDIRQTDGNENFQMDWCLDAFAVHVAADSKFGEHYELDREITYN